MCVAVNFRKIYEKKTLKKSKEVILFCLKYKYFSKLVSYCNFLRCVICDFVDSCSENKPYGEKLSAQFSLFQRSHEEGFVLSDSEVFSAVSLKKITKNASVTKTGQTNLLTLIFQPNLVITRFFELFQR